MKKIILCMALSVLCLVGSVGSFLASDAPRYGGMAYRHMSRWADDFGRWCDPGRREGPRHHMKGPGPAAAPEGPARGPVPPPKAAEPAPPAPAAPTAPPAADAAPATPSGN